MPEQSSTDAPAARGNTGRAAAWSPPHFEVIPLDCEITAYAPDGDDPLF